MYIIVTRKDTVKDIIAHEEMEGFAPEVYRKGEQYAVKAQGGYGNALGEVADNIGGDWELCKEF